MKKALFILVIVLSMKGQSFAHKNGIEKADSLLFLLKTSKADTGKVKLLFSLAYETMNNNPDTALYFANESKALAIKLNDRTGIADACLASGNALIRLGQYEKALKCTQDALNLYDKILHMPERTEKKIVKRWILKQEASVYKLSGTIYHYQGNYDEALKNYFAAIKILEEIDNKELIAQTYSNIGVIYSNLANYPEALKMHFKVLKMEEEIGDSNMIGSCYTNIGTANKDLGNYPEALKNYFTALKFFKEPGDKREIAACYVSIGIVFFDQGKYPEALKYYFSALKFQEEIGNKRGLANSYTNIAIVYDERGNFADAKKYYFKALKLTEEMGDKAGISNIYLNLGLSYQNQGNYPEALKTISVSLKIQKEIGDKRGIAYNYSTLGEIHMGQGHYDTSLKDFFSSLQILKEIGFKEGIGDAYNKIGSAYTKLKKYNDASFYLNKGLSVAKEIGSLKSINDSYQCLAALDSAQGNFRQSLEYFKLYIATRDSMFNSENTKKLVQSQMQDEFDKKQLLDSLDNEKDILQKEISYRETLHKTNTQRNIFLFCGLAILVLSGGLWSRLRYISRSTAIIRKEKNRSEDLLLNILPSEVAEELKQTGHCKAKTYSMVTVMFTDFKDFTRVSEMVSAEQMVDELNFCFSSFDTILQNHKVEKIKTVGDAYMCASGLPALNHSHAFDLVTAAIEIRNFMLNRKKEKEAKGEIPLEIRIGIHTGPVVAGIVGIKKFSYDIWGDTVNLAARMESSGEAGKVNISGTTYEHVKDKFSCTYRGKIEAKNKGEIDMYFVEYI